MSEQIGRPRVWWSPAQGVIEQVEPRWPDEPMRCVRTRDRYVVPVPDDAVELHAAPEPDPSAPEGRDIYVHITQGLVVSTKEVADGVCVDLDAGGDPVGVEILGAIGVDADGKPVAHAPEPTGDAVETVARVLYDMANRDIGDPDPWEECGYRDVYRGMARAAIAAMPQQGDVEQYRHLLGCIWLYVDWKYVTRQLTTVQKWG